ncbi:hypothetical protein F6U93_00180 [Tamlana haliotis]|uniref:Outer membrane protein beta-barrel domain-containing protein n=1 Tax=Pseudotamlana haliotis TaxID=2614804 RepID=A0A6N6MKY1_9FLAO|nr:hypothetical protein [Tamlana haliotis]KAB1071895.1 hypothetical protein F6U93_00180 [Tamlana haliotis]
MNKIFYKSLILLFLLLSSNFIFGQDITSEDFQIHTNQKYTYSQVDLSLPLQVNIYRDDYLENESYENSDSWFIPDGVEAILGYGLHYKEWIGLTANTGVSTILSRKLVTVPVFANLRLMPINKGTFNMGIDAGLGKSFALGRGRLSGTFQRYKLFVGNDTLNVFIVLQTHGYFVYDNEAGSLNIGISILDVL